MLADYHVHTYYSADSEYPMENVIRDAINLGIDEICFTDHVDYGVLSDYDDEIKIEKNGEILLNTNYPEYMKDLKDFKEKYKDKISIKVGLEFGMQRHTIGRFEALFKRYDFDFIIMSVHAIDNLELWDQEFQTGKSQEEYINAYYDEILYLVKNYKNYSVLGHLDAIVRYDLVGNFPFEKIKDKIIEILKIVIEDGKGIELNTSSKRYGIKDLTPSREILRLYKDLGGKIITIGSDSHKPSHLGKYLEEAKKELLKLGFIEYSTFDKMKVTYHNL